jgi:hypothetical protein
MKFDTKDAIIKVLKVLFLRGENKLYLKISEIFTYLFFGLSTFFIFNIINDPIIPVIVAMRNGIINISEVNDNCIKKPEINVANKELAAPIVLSIPIIAPRCIVGERSAINAEKAGAIIDPKNDCIPITNMNNVGDLMPIIKAQSIDDKIPPTTIKSTLLPVISLNLPQNIWAAFGKKFVTA